MNINIPKPHGKNLAKKAIILRQLADKFQGLSDGRIKFDDDEELNKIRLLAQVVARELMDGWL